MDVGNAKSLVEAHFINNQMPIGQFNSLWQNVLILIHEVGRKHFEIAAYTSDGESPM